jgi:cell division protein FtsI/penicillin-binding protein 2
MIKWRDHARILLRHALRRIDSWRDPPFHNPETGYAGYLAFARSSSDRRLLVVAFLFGFWFLAISVRLVNLQVVRREYFSEQAERLTRARFLLPPVRGEISGRNGWILAADISAVSLYADPNEVEDVNEVATKLGVLLRKEPAQIANKLQAGKEKKQRFIWLARKLSPTVSLDEITQESGVHRVNEPKRVYPYGTFAACLLGFVGLDHTGLFGLELSQNKYLEGRPMEILAGVDGGGRVYDYREIAGARGHNVITSIDEYLQSKATLIAEAAVRTTGAESVSIVVMKPKTGEVLSLVNTPGFDPGLPKVDDLHRYRIPPIADVYELESINRILRFSFESEASLLNNRRTSNTPDHAQSNELNNLRQMGLGERTGIELPGEASGTIHEDGTKVNGLRIQASSIQILCAFSAIGNGGIWVQPHVVNRIDSPNGETVYRPTPATRTVINEGVAKILIDTLRKTYERQESLWSQPYQAAAIISEGSQTMQNGRGGVSTIVGVAPANGPEYAVIVTFVHRAGVKTPEQIVTRTFDQVVKAAFGGYSIDQTVATK